MKILFNIFFFSQIDFQMGKRPIRNFIIIIIVVVIIASFRINRVEHSTKTEFFYGKQSLFIVAHVCVIIDLCMYCISMMM